MSMDVAEAPVFTTTWFADRSLQLWTDKIKPLGPFKNYLEIGTHEGASFIFVIQNLLDPLHSDAHAVGIDNFEPSRNWQRHIDRANEAKELWKKNVMEPYGERAWPLVSWWDTSSEEALALLVADALGMAYAFDLIYVNAAHEAEDALYDLMMSWRLLVPGGIVIVDDIHLHQFRRRNVRPKVKEALAAFMGTHFVPKKDTVIYRTTHQIAMRKSL